MHRRDFLRTGLAGGAWALSPLGLQRPRLGRSIALVFDPADPIAASAPVQWAAGELERALIAGGASVRRVPRLGEAATTDLAIVGTGATRPPAQTTFKSAAAPAAWTTGPEGVAVGRTRVAGRDAIVAAGSDARGLVYALLDLVDRLSFMPPEAALALGDPVVERPANAVRSVMRQFTSEVYDTPWLFDRAFWPPYLTMLASQRFNRVHLAFGLGYDTLQGVVDSYLLFLYPFLVTVPGYDVTMTGVTAADRTKTLEMLRFISDEAVRRGLDFQLGVWMHGYKLINSPRARYIVQGLTDEQHPAYCRDALAAVLRACPSISSVGLRIHGESGIAEGSYEFWKTVFDGVSKSGRRVEIDLHAKGIDQTMIEHAIGTGMPVNVSPKYWAEHLGMPYHQAAIRDLEMPAAGQVGRGLMTLSEGQRSFTRYGYADLLRDDRRYTVRHRIFSGTQRLLVSGDPQGTSAYGRMFSFCGSTGFDLMEPLTCRGRRGTAVEGTRRSGYADPKLESTWDWQKFDYTYRVWGRMTFNPDAPADVTRRGLVAPSLFESDLANVSRILPIVTTAYLPSAACDAYWPEVYWNQPIAAEPRPNPYGDSPQPRTFQHASPLDPQLFSGMTEHAEELLKGERSGKYSPIEVAAWLDALAAQPPGRPIYSILTAGGDTAALARLFPDLDVQRGLGRFFAAKFRAGVLYAIHERSNDRRALEEAIKAYRSARDRWASLSASASSVYAADLAASDKISNRGAWADRLPAIDQDIAAMAARLAGAVSSADPAVGAAVDAALAPPQRPSEVVTHTPPDRFRAGGAVAIDIALGQGTRVTSAGLYYRHVNQAERYVRQEMAAAGRRYHGVIPAAYTESPYALQYYVELRNSPSEAWLYPGLGPDRLGQPYIVISRAM